MKLTPVAIAHRRNLRHQCRSARRQLSRQQQQCARERLARRVTTSNAFLSSQRIACYLPDDGEIDPTPIIKSAWRMGKAVYLPRLIARDNMQFFPYRQNMRLRRGRWNLREPASAAAAVPIWSLDLVILPLVSFDNEGSRLGRGGGFYDRTLQRRREQKKIGCQPFLLGVAHQCQQRDAIPVASWDQPMHAIATDRQWYHCPR